jgi:hypothetical protein
MNKISIICKSLNRLSSITNKRELNIIWVN